MNPIYCGLSRPFAQSLGITGLACMLMAPGTGAADAWAQGRVAGTPTLDRGTTFDLHLAREDLAIAYDDDSAGGDLRLRRLGISFHEALSPSMRLGVRLGWAGLTQSDRTSTAGVEPDGHFVALELAAGWPPGSLVGLGVGATWRYTRASATDETGNRTELDWQALELRPGIRMGLASGVSARVGASLTAIDGDELQSGASSSTTKFSVDDQAGAFLALDFAWADGDAITLRARGGNPTGLYVSFEQRY